MTKIVTVSARYGASNTAVRSILIVSVIQFFRGSGAEHAMATVLWTIFAGQNQFYFVYASMSAAMIIGSILAPRFLEKIVSTKDGNIIVANGYCTDLFNDYVSPAGASTRASSWFTPVLPRAMTNSRKPCSTDLPMSGWCSRIDTASLITDTAVLASVVSSFAKIKNSLEVRKCSLSIDDQRHALTLGRLTFYRKLWPSNIHAHRSRDNPCLCAAPFFPLPGCRLQIASTVRRASSAFRSPRS